MRRYVIQIDEDQHARINKALDAVKGSIDPNDLGFKLLLDRFKDIPRVEEDYPYSLHILCS